ncbi:MAG: hypothetical protein JWQ81_8791 [Amycolatopsis sp.]|jgi:hypothetical protein|uniref:DUF4097 family beta strand repeat-containing protein n=1 Tax=Amycolatopsis sp. TaxID=37632 RepID=UPI002610D494|nr:DUF4097 family beta strand repeat-containing protein [Amycolatopsis sp.]MCU1688052.1 hypothetical protein [Amycolatopsis sp.]
MSEETENTEAAGNADNTPDADNTAVTEDSAVRTDTFSVDGPIEIDISLTLGKVVINLDSANDAGEATVELRPDASAKPEWVGSMTNMLNWVNERFGNALGGDWDGDPAEALRQTRVEKLGNRLVVQASKAMPLRNVPLAVTVRAPAGSHLSVRAGAADVTVSGSAGRADIATGSGQVTLGQADGPAVIRTGTGGVKLGPTLAGLQLRTASGDVEATSLSGSATLATGTSDVWLGAVAGDVMARSGSGNLSVAEASSGSLELITGSGEVRIGVSPGVAAEVELSSGAGKVSSELDVADSAPEGGVALKVRARTGSGNAVVTRAAK